MIRDIPWHDTPWHDTLAPEQRASARNTDDEASTRRTITGEAIRRLPSLVTEAVIAVASEIVAFGSLDAYVVTGVMTRGSAPTTAATTT